MKTLQLISLSLAGAALLLLALGAGVRLGADSAWVADRPISSQGPGPSGDDALATSGVEARD